MSNSQQEAEAACLAEIKRQFAEHPEQHRLGREAEDVFRQYISAWFDLPDGTNPPENSEDFFFYFRTYHERPPFITPIRCRELFQLAVAVCQQHVNNFRQNQTASSPRRLPATLQTRAFSPVRRPISRPTSPGGSPSRSESPLRYARQDRTSPPRSPRSSPRVLETHLDVLRSQFTTFGESAQSLSQIVQEQREQEERERREREERERQERQAREEQRRREEQEHYQQQLAQEEQRQKEAQERLEQARRDEQRLAEQRERELAEQRRREQQQQALQQQQQQRQPTPPPQTTMSGNGNGGTSSGNTTGGTPNTAQVTPPGSEAYAPHVQVLNTLLNSTPIFDGSNLKAFEASVSNALFAAFAACGSPIRARPQNQDQIKEDMVTGGRVLALIAMRMAQSIQAEWLAYVLTQRNPPPNAGTGTEGYPFIWSAPPPAIAPYGPMDVITSHDGTTMGTNLASYPTMREWLHTNYPDGSPSVVTPPPTKLSKIPWHTAKFDGKPEHVNSWIQTILSLKQAH